ncbi:MAG: hypothetical protein SLAVMIC_00367 [uncultured marine phage]|uniref:Uncharacterized protein n=1 Tax=uncultured marine phage TaxID=707152 RepID=A0A8D9CCX6_9VIRU|nr:MAG: hypothetical protein SLAVMIC_00367 [uncultured marine phage]
MTVNEIINIVEKPLNEITGDKMEFRDYREIAKERPDLYKDRDNNYDLLLWYNPSLDLGVTITLRDTIRLELNENDSAIVSHTFFSKEIEEINLDYFMLACKTMFESKIKMLEFRFKNLPKDFIRDYRLKTILNK